MVSAFPSRRSAGGLAVIGALLSIAACGQADTSQTPARRPLVTAQDSTLYAVGQGLAAQFNLHGLFTETELQLVTQGFSEGVLGTGEVQLEDHLEAMNQMIQERRDGRSNRLQTEGDAFVLEQGKTPGAMTTESGLVYIEQTAGTGAAPTATDSVVVHYEGSFSDGTVFDSSLRRGEPVGFRLGKVIPGWREGLQLMKAGGKAKLVVPSKLGYGERGFPPAIPANVPLIFEVELIEVHP